MNGRVRRDRGVADSSVAAATQPRRQGPANRLAEPRGRLIIAARLTRANARSHPNAFFVFGDNLVGRGRGGQARELRGEPNSIGIPTKHLPTREPQAYFRDEDLKAVEPVFDAIFERLSHHMSCGRRDVKLTGRVYPMSHSGLGTCEKSGRGERGLSPNGTPDRDAPLTESGVALPSVSPRRHRRSLG